jgi:transposase
MRMLVEPEGIYFHLGHVDFRKSINGLLTIIKTQLEMNAFMASLFIFTNRKKYKLKLLYLYKTGFAS